MPQAMTSQPPDGRLRHILVVEDDEAIRLSVEIVLYAEGYDVFGCPTGTVGLQHAANQRPDLILLDLLMPDMGGATFIELYHRQPGPHAPIVLMSAGDENSIRQMRLSPIAAFLPKPYSPQQLIEMVRNHTSVVGRST